MRLCSVCSVLVWLGYLLTFVVVVVDFEFLLTSLFPPFMFHLEGAQQDDMEISPGSTPTSARPSSCTGTC